MKRTISNGVLTFISDNAGAEPLALRFNGDASNYLWQDEAGAKPVTAICFPLLGALPDGAYILEGKRYAMGMHGFAQFRDFRVAEHTEERIAYEIRDDENSREQYPYRFRLRAEYALYGSTLTVTYRVKNLDSRELYFSVGGHPRFACPVRDSGGSAGFADHFIEFEKPESIDTIVKSYAPLSAIEACFNADRTKLRLDYALFEKGCFCFSRLNSSFFTLKNSKNERALRFHPEGASHVQLWTMPGADYIALEPWYGSITSLPPKPEDRVWTERPGALHIPPETEYACAYRLTCMKSKTSD
jgi:galactose mutarotase-like enzyme